MSGSKGPLSGGLTPIADQRFLGNFTGAPATPAATEIVQGANITLTPGAGTLTIAASGTSLSSITTGFIFANFSGGAAAPQGVQLLAGTGITFSGTTTSLTITASGSVTAPTIVQQATDRSTTTGDTTLSPTFGGNTTIGNYLIFIVTGYSHTSGGGTVTVTTPAIQGFFFRERALVTNQGVAVFVWKVLAAATAYTVTVASPNGGESVLVLEINNLNRIEANAFVPVLSGATASLTLTIQQGALNVLTIENDNDTGAIVAQTSGLTTLYSGHGTVNHAGYFFSVNDSLQGGTANVQFTSNPTGGSSLMSVITLTA